MAKKPNSFLRRTASEVKQYRKWMRITPFVLGAISVLLIMVYIITILYSRYGSFTVTIKRFEDMECRMSLYDSIDFLTPYSQLNMNAITEIDNIDGSTDIPDYLDDIDGEHSAENYAAYTFYCRNESSKKTFSYQYQLFIANATQGIEKAIRVRLYVDGVPTTYAHTSTDGSGAEEGTTKFYGDEIIEKSNRTLAPKEYTKFTVVIWIEGPDKDCVDDLIGGRFKVGMTMSVLKVEGED